MNFYADNKNWNSIANLHLLNDSQNLSKKDKPLMTWVTNEKINISALTIVPDISLEFSAFKEFYDMRRSELKRKLTGRVFMTSNPLLADIKIDEDDEEVIEDITE